MRYAKRGRLRFTSHRDFTRAFERALRRAGVPMAYSAGFTPHPKISYVGSVAPTGVASEAEYLEVGLASVLDVDRLRAALDVSLPDGLDLLECVEVRAGSDALADRIDASRWRIELDLPVDQVAEAVDRFLATDEVMVERMTKQGSWRRLAQNLLLLRKLEDFRGGDGRFDAVPVCVIKKREIFSFIEKRACLLCIAALERDRRNVHVSERMREGVQCSASGRDVARLGEKGRVDGGTVGNQEND